MLFDEVSRDRFEGASFRFRERCVADISICGSARNMECQPSHYGFKYGRSKLREKFF